MSGKLSALKLAFVFGLLGATSGLLLILLSGMGDAALQASGASGLQKCILSYAWLFGGALFVISMGIAAGIVVADKAVAKAMQQPVNALLSEAVALGAGRSETLSDNSVDPVAALDLAVKIVGLRKAEGVALLAKIAGLESDVAKAQARIPEVREQAEESRRSGLLSASRTLGKSIEGIHGASENLMALSRNARGGAQEQQNLVGRVASVMDEFNSAVRQMSARSSDAVLQAQQAQDKARSGAQVVEQTVEAIRQVERKAEDLAAVVRDLGSQAMAVEKIMEVISDIADQTNLLALNAAIEAARAGDAGRGFAVVADEVRKLAEKTMGATREVAQRIEGIQKGVERTGQDMRETAEKVDQAVNLAQTSGASLVEIVDLAGHTARHIDGIASDVNRQADMSAQISTIVSKVSEISESSHEGAQNSMDAVDGLLERVVALESMNSVFQLIGDGGVQKLVETMACSPAVASMSRETVEKAMGEALRANPAIELLYATDRSGRQFISNMGRSGIGIKADTSAVGKDWSGRPWFKQPMALGGTVVSDVYVSSATGENCITVSTPIYGDDHVMQGLLAADINLGKALQNGSRTC